MFHTESPLEVELEMIPVNPGKLINRDMSSCHAGD